MATGQSPCVGLGLGLGWTPALSVTHSDAAVAYADCNAT